MKERQIDITKQDVRFCDELVVDEKSIEAEYELWFDVDKYFGTDTKSDDDVWINFYTYWRPDNTITAIYCIDSPEKIESIDWKLTKEEETFFLKLMEDYCQKCHNKSLNDLWREIWE